MTTGPNFVRGKQKRPPRARTAPFTTCRTPNNKTQITPQKKNKTKNKRNESMGLSNWYYYNILFRRQQPKKQKNLTGSTASTRAGGTSTRAGGTTDSSPKPKPPSTQFLAPSLSTATSPPATPSSPPGPCRASPAFHSQARFPGTSEPFRGTAAGGLVQGPIMGMDRSRLATSCHAFLLSRVILEYHNGAPVV